MTCELPQYISTSSYTANCRVVDTVKIIEKNISQGFVKVVPDSPDDLWHLYNVIYQGDEVYAYSSRAIKSDTETSPSKKR